MRKRFLACLLSLSIAFTQMPVIAFAEDETAISGADATCTLTEGCTLLSGHEGNCEVKADTDSVCAGLDGCVEGQHDEACPLYVVSSGVEQDDDTKVDEKEKNSNDMGRPSKKMIMVKKVKILRMKLMKVS